MTREEIEQLKWYFEYDNGLSADKETVEAYKMAIKALSALDKVIVYCKKSPSAILPEDVLSLIRGEDVEIETDYGYEKFEPCDDAVSRETVKELIKSGVSTDTYDDVEYVCERIDALPSVNPQPKIGHWIHGEYCSECGYDVPAYIIDWKWQNDPKAKYCSNCGCRMIGQQKSEEV